MLTDVWLIQTVLAGVGLAVVMLGIALFLLGPRR